MSPVTSFLKLECKSVPCGPSWACLFLSICNFFGHLYLHPSYCHERFYVHFCNSVPSSLLPFFMETLYLYLLCPNFCIPCSNLSLYLPGVLSSTLLPHLLLPSILGIPFLSCHMCEFRILLVLCRPDR